MTYITRWAILLFSIYVLSALAQFYLDGRGQILDFTYTGLRRSGLLLFSAVTCIVLCVSLLRTYLRHEISESSVDSGRDHDSKDSAAHFADRDPLRVALERHPWHICSLVIFALCIPLLLRFIEAVSVPVNTWKYWRPVVYGEALVVLLLAAGVIVAGRRIRQRQ